MPARLQRRTRWITYLQVDFAFILGMTTVLLI
jgi:hypothetical protein